MNIKILPPATIANKEQPENNALALKPGLLNPYIHLATSENTRKAYRHDIHHYENWGGRLPASPEIIAQYLQFFAEKLNPHTLSRRLIALRHWHTYQGFADPTLHPAIQKTMLGIRRKHGRPKQKAHAISIEQLNKISTYLAGQKSLSAARDNALLLIGFFGAFRRSELVAIAFEHIQWSNAGIEILIPSSKTDQLHAGQYCAIPYGNNTLCPIRSLQYWLSLARINSGAIFRRLTLAQRLGENALTPLSVNLILRQRARAAGLTEIATLSSHSLRRGLATCAARSGARLEVIMRAGRWKQTNTVMEYIEASERFTENAAASVLQLVDTSNDAK